MTEVKISLTHDGQVETFVINTDKDVTAEFLKKEITEIIGSRPRKRR